MSNKILAPSARQRFFDNAGAPLAGGLLYTYQAGTTTPQVTYSNQSGTTNANPVVLDAYGYADIWLDSSFTYKFVLEDSLNNVLWTEDNISVASGSSSSSSGTGFKNYIQNPDFETASVANWSLGHVTLTSNFPSGVPTFGTGASGTLSISATSSNPLAGKESLSYASSGATTAGDFLATDAFTIDIEDQAKVLSFSFYYSAVTNPTNCNFSGTSSNSFGVAIYDVTNSAWIQPAGVFNIVQGTGVGIATGTFQTTSNSTQYRFVVYNANATSGAATIYMDTFLLGPLTIPIGAAMSDFGSVPWTPTGSWSANSTYTGEFRRLGDSLEAHVKIALSGAPTSANLSVNIPSWLSIDTTKISADGTVTPVGQAGGSHSGAFTFVATYGSTTSVDILYQNASTGGLAFVDATAPVTWGSGDYLDISFTVPISGWSSNTVMSSDTDTRVIGASAYLSTNTAVSSSNPIKYDTVSYDLTASYSRSTGLYTCPVSGVYRIAVTCQTTSATGNVYLSKNGGNNGYLTAISGSVSGGAIDVKCKSGDTLGIYSDSSVTFTGAGGSATIVSFSRISGPAVVAASETVAAMYTGAPPTGTLAAAFNTVTFGTKVNDSHACYSGGTYTVPISGTYTVNAQIRVNGTYSLNGTTQAAVFVNGSNVKIGVFVAGGSNTLGLADVNLIAYPLKSGDLVTIRAYTDASTPTFSSSAIENVFSIVRVGN